MFGKFQRRGARMLDLRYGDVEQALIGAFEVPGEYQSKFKARLKNFRRIGVPIMPAPGTGRHLSYALADIRALHMAMVLNQSGHAPEVIAALFNTESGDVRQWYQLAELAAQHDDGPVSRLVFAAVFIRTFGNPSDQPWFRVLIGEDTIPPIPEKGFMSRMIGAFTNPLNVPCTLINISACNFAVLRALRRLDLLPMG